MEITIGAIFKDEFDYVIEWLAWHRMAGFEKFVIADNGSTDRTLALLEALKDVGLIDVIYQPSVKAGAQVIAYRRICEQNLNEPDAVLFLDADEFLVHSSYVDGAEYKELHRLLNTPEVGMVGINWRCFGSSGLENNDRSPVVARFIKYGRDHATSKNCHLKSVTKIAYAYQIGPHISYLYPPYKRLDVSGSELKDFIQIVNGEIVRDEGMPEGLSRNIVTGPLRVHHYVIKSKEEFTKKKLNKGDAMGGESFKKGMTYFEAHDFSDAELAFPDYKLQRLNSYIAEISQQVGTATNFPRKLIGAVDKSNEKYISGWVCDQTQEGNPIYVSVYVNEIFQAKTKAGYFRPDLKGQGISKNGMCGFYFHHQMPLSAGDVVEVKVVSNNCKLMGAQKAVIVAS